MPYLEDFGDREKDKELPSQKGGINALGAGFAAGLTEEVFCCITQFLSGWCFTSGIFPFNPHPKGLEFSGGEIGSPR